MANKHSITMDQLRNWNNIKNDFIYPGQHLVVKNDTGSKSQANKTTAISSVTNAGSYTVASGDSVWSVANKHGITMDQLRSWNNIKNDFIYPGQSVRVSGTATAANQTASTSNYTVVSGDSVWGIADKFGISRDQFIQWNNIKDNFVYPGQSVRVK